MVRTNFASDPPGWYPFSPLDLLPFPPTLTHPRLFFSIS